VSVKGRPSLADLYNLLGCIDSVNKPFAAKPGHDAIGKDQYILDFGNFKNR
jgi:hypothetical protein